MSYSSQGRLVIGSYEGTEETRLQPYEARTLPGLIEME